MSNIPRLKKRAVELEQKKQFDRALDVYIQILDEGGRDLDDGDVPLFNRVGDLLIRNGKVTDALGYYERAVDLYAERGYLNNAIALCNKILRQSPGRTAVYYKLAKISASKGFRSDARKNFLEYADRVQKAGNLDEAFRALKEFASIYPDEEDVRLILAEQLSKENRKSEALEQLQTLYQKLQGEGRRAEARATIDRMKAIDPHVFPRTSGAHGINRPNDLVFLDLTDAEGDSRRASPTPSAERALKGQKLQSSEPALEGLLLTFLPDEDDAAAGEVVRPVDGLERARDTIDDGDAASTVAMPDDTARTGETSIIADAPPPSAIIEGNGEQTVVFTEGLVLEPVVTDIDFIPSIDAERAYQPGEDAVGEPSLLSGIQFAELDLSEQPRPAEPREHDLALPSALPLLEPAAEGLERALPANADADQDPVEFEEEPDELLIGHPAAPLATGESDAALVAEVLEDFGFPEGPSGDMDAPSDNGSGVPDDVLVSAMEETLATVMGDAAVPDLQPIDNAPVVTYDDLLSTTPSFGSTTASEGPAFPLIDGLSDDPRAVGKDASPSVSSVADDSPNGSEPAAPTVESVEPNDAAADADQLVLDPAAEIAAAGDNANGRVDAPLPQGFDGATPANGRSRRDAGNDATGIRAARAGTSDRGLTPRATVSIGGAEEHLRRRLELEPENWALRRQLGEALLEAGNRDGGLYELELAMTAFDMSDALDHAQEIVDEILRITPSSVRHHQKRVEFAVRAKDLARLVESYLELADALFRTGAGDKSVAVYARVVELAPENERALFALATLAPDQLERLRGAPARQERWSEELEVIPDGGSLTVETPLESATPLTEDKAVVLPSPSEDVTPNATEGAAVTAEQPVVGIKEKRHADLSPPDDSTVAPGVDDASDSQAPAGATAVAPRHQPESEAVPAPPVESSILNRVRSITPPPTHDESFVDLGEWLRNTEPEKSTRMVANDARPTGDERADFEDLLRRFKRGVAENVDAEDFEAHYDLGVAFKEMGLLDEAIAQFQKALRGSANRVRAYEALGQCFVEKEQYPIAAALLQRAIETPGTDDQQLVGVLYLLGFASEQMGRHAEGLRYYQRVFAVDLEFRDITQRVAAMEHLSK